MIEVQVTGQGLEVVVTSGDAWLLATRLRWQITVPLDQVIAATTAPPLGTAVRKHVLDKETGRLVCARQRAPAVVIELDGHPFRRMTLSVPDPPATASAITDAIRLRR